VERENEKNAAARLAPASKSVELDIKIRQKRYVLSGGWELERADYDKESNYYAERIPFCPPPLCPPFRSSVIAGSGSGCGIKNSSKTLFSFRFVLNNFSLSSRTRTEENFFFYSLIPFKSFFTNSSSIAYRVEEKHLHDKALLVPGISS
jgi:hypothetical protein